MLDVLMLTNNDWGNSGWRCSECLRMLGLNVRFLKGREHHPYPEQGEVYGEITKGTSELSVMVSAPKVRSLAKEAHVIHFIASTFVDTGVDLTKKNVIVQHGGSAYRQNPEIINEFFNRYAHTTIIQMPDLLGLGANGEVWISFPVDTTRLQPLRAPDGRVRVGHFPTNPAVKGTEKILKVISGLEADPTLKDQFEYVGVRGGGSPRNLLPWRENLNRMRGCDILVETCNLTQTGKQYGEWGNTAVEGAALGKIVVTNSLSIERYEDEYGKCPLVIANSEVELEDALRELITADRAWLRTKALEMREWVVKYHSMAVTAEKLRERVYSKFFDFDKDRSVI